MSNITPPKPKIITSEGQTVLRLIPALANEIGMVESVVLLQIAYWIGISNNLRDGDWWTYQSLNDMRQKAFPFWSRATIDRAIHRLECRNLIKISAYNLREKDKTRWFALDTEGLELLESVCVVSQNETDLYQNETSCLKMRQALSQNETDLYQNETALPETTTESTSETTTQTTTESSSRARAHEGALEPQPDTTTTNAPVNMQQMLRETGQGNSRKDPRDLPGNTPDAPEAPPPSSAPPPSPAALAGDALWRAYVAGGGVDAVPTKAFGLYAGAWRRLADAGASAEEVERMTRDKLDGRAPDKPYRFTFLPDDLAEWRRGKRSLLTALSDGKRYTSGIYASFIQAGPVHQTAQASLGG
jgi:hypothetical protein